jgi:RimJ/RimL family protein N-acetyltransferase
VTEASPLLRRQGVTGDGRGWLIRPSSGTDAPALVALRDSVAAEGRWIAAVPGDTSVVEESLGLAGLLSQGGLALTLEVDGTVAGQLQAQRADAGSGDRAELALIIVGEQRGRGLGRALLQTAIAWGRAVGLRRMVLAVLPDNDAAIHLYRSSGFVEEGTRPRAISIAGVERDAVVMGLDLAAAAPG